jgi:hypothetical protein
MINFPKLLLGMEFTKVNLVGITCMEEKGLQSKCQTVWFEKIINSLNLKFKTYNISWMGQTRKDFIQASKIYSELLYMHCSCYSNTRGITPPRHRYGILVALY